MVNTKEQFMDASGAYLAEKKLSKSDNSLECENLVPTGYKQTDIGVIPADWQVVSLGSVASFIKGNGLPKSELDVNGIIPCIHYGELFTTYGAKIKKIYSRTNQIYDSYILSHENDILMPTSDVTPNGLATASCILTNGTVLGGDILVVRPRANELNGVFFAYLVVQNRERVMQLVSGSTVYHLYGSDMSRLRIAKPRIFEQIEIANALSDVDALIDSLEALIAKKQAIKTATMQQLLTGRTRLQQFARRPDGTLKGIKHTELGEIPEDWEVISLGEVTAFTKGAGLPKSELDDHGEYPCIHYGQLFTQYGPSISAVFSRTNNGNSNAIMSKSNDILMPTSDVTPNGLATACCIQQDDVILGGDILIIRPKPDTIDGVFFSYLVEVIRDRVIQLVTGSTVYHLYGSEMAKLSIPKPPIKEQEAIANVLCEMDEEIQALQQRLTKTLQIKQAMMQELLTGRIRLI